MIRRPPRSTRTDTLFPYTTLFRSWHQLMQRFGSGEAALDALPDLVLRGGAGKPRIAPAEVAEREIERVAALGARHIFSDEDAYSPMLREVEGAPPVVDRRSVVSGKGVAVRVDLGCRRDLKKK